MFRPLFPVLVSAAASVAVTHGAAFAQSADASSQDAPRQIRDRLAEDGFKDIHVEPGSYIVSAKDKHGRSVLMMIGPNSTTMLTSPDSESGDSTAQLPDDTDKPIPQ